MHHNIFFLLNVIDGRWRRRQIKIFFYKKLQRKSYRRVFFNSEIIFYNFLWISFRDTVHKSFSIGKNFRHLYILKKFTINVVGSLHFYLSLAQSKRKNKEEDKSSFFHAGKI